MLLPTFLYMCLIHVKGIKTKKNNDKMNKKKKKHEENFKSRTPPPSKNKIKTEKKEQPVRFEPKEFFCGLVINPPRYHLS